MISTKTLEQILEGVTAGGQWSATAGVLRAGLGRDRVADFMHGLHENDRLVNAAYAARACSTWPALVRALDLIITHGITDHQLDTLARGAMNEALRAPNDQGTARQRL
jgi:hypothetical protein